MLTFLCLGFAAGGWSGSNPLASIVLGGSPATLSDNMEPSYCASYWYGRYSPCGPGFNGGPKDHINMLYHTGIYRTLPCCTFGSLVTACQSRDIKGMAPCNGAKRSQGSSWRSRVGLRGEGIQGLPITDSRVTLRKDTGIPHRNYFMAEIMAPTRLLL